MKRQMIALALGLALLGAGSAQAVVIDNFSTAQAAINLPTGGAAAPPSESDSSTLMDVAGTINIPGGGGTRTMSLEVTEAVAGFGAETRILSGPGVFNLNADSGVESTTTVTWTTDNPVNLLAAPGTYPGDTTGCTSVDNCFIIFGVNGLDQSIFITVTLEDDDGDSATNTYFKYRQQIDEPTVGDPTFVACSPSCPQVVGSIFGSPVDDIFGNYYHALSPFRVSADDPATGDPFDPLSDPATLALDLDSIVRILFSITTTTSSLDFTVDCIYTSSRASTGVDANGFPTFDPSTTDGDRNACITASAVPEPASLLLMGTGLLGVGLVGLRTRSRRRQQA